MPGLDPTVIKTIKETYTISRIIYDTRTDFILSPHFYAVYKNAAREMAYDYRRDNSGLLYSRDYPLVEVVLRSLRIVPPGAPDE